MDRIDTTEFGRRMTFVRCLAGFTSRELSLKAGANQGWAARWEGRKKSQLPVRLDPSVAHEVATACAGEMALAATAWDAIYTFLLGGDPVDLLATLTYPTPPALSVIEDQAVPKASKAAASIASSSDIPYLDHPAVRPGPSRTAIRERMQDAA